jgi:hypothetical protein
MESYKRIMKTFIICFPDGSTTKIKAHSISPDFSNGVIILMDESMSPEAVLVLSQVRYVAEESTLNPG